MISVRRLAWILPVIALVGFTAKRVIDERAKTADQAKQSQSRKNQKPAVQTAVAGPREIVQIVSTVGTVDSLETVQVSPRTQGRLLSVLVREGDAVKKGQLIATLDPADLQGAVTEAQAGVAQAESQLAASLATQGSTVINLQGQIKTQQAAVAGARAEVSEALRTAQALIAAQKAAVAEAKSRVDAAKTAVKSAQAGVVSAKASEQNAQGKADRSQTLFGKGYISAQANEDTQSALRVAQAQTNVAIQAQDSAVANVSAAQAQANAAQSQVLVVQRQTEAAIATARAKLAQAQAALSVANANTAQGPAYQQSLDALRSAVSAAQSRLVQAQAKAADVNLFSPIDGTVTQRAADPGSLASPGTAILTLRSISNLEISANLPEDQAALIDVGARGAATIDDKNYDVTVARVNRSVDTDSRQFTVQLRFFAENPSIRSGMFARVQITAHAQQVPVAVPLNAVDSGNVSVVGDDEKIERREVDEGAKDSDFVEIKTNLKAGEKVVVQSYTPVKDGQTVRTGEKKGKGEGGGKGRRQNP